MRTLLRTVWLAALLVCLGVVWTPAFAQDGDDDEMSSADAGVDEDTDALFIGQALDPRDEAEEEDDEDEMARVDLPTGKADDGRSPIDEEDEAAPEDFSRTGELSGGAGMGCHVHAGTADWPLALLLLAYLPTRRRR